MERLLALAREAHLSWTQLGRRRCRRVQQTRRTAVNYRLLAAAATLAFACISGKLGAEPASNSFTTLAYNSSTKVVTGVDNNWVQHNVRHVPATTHLFAD